MPAPQLIPPGHLDLHVVVVAATPALIAVIAGLATVIAGGGRVARTLGWLCLSCGFGLLVLFLRPHGVSSSFTYPLDHGWVRVGPCQVLGSIISGGYAAWWNRPSPERGPWGWGVRTALALVLPICLFACLVLGCEWDLQRSLPQTHASRFRRMRPLLVALAAVLGYAALASHPAQTLSDPLPARLAMAAACGLVALLGETRWALPMAIAGASALAPLAAP
jgi:hypothetical protein